MSFINDIKTKILARLNNIGDPVKAVYGYDAPDKFESKPAVTLSYVDHEAQLYTTSENLRDVQFLARVYVSAGSNETAEEDIINCVEAIIDDLESDPTLTGTSINLLCNSAPIDTENSTEDIRVANINILVQVIKTR